MDYTKLRDQVKEMESRQAAMTPSAADTPVIPPKEGLFTSIAKGAGGFAKELYKGVVRPLATPFAGLQAGITGKEVQYSDWLGGARGSNDPAKQAKIAGGAALEAASLIPAGKGLAAMRGLKGLRGKELAKFALMEARYGAKTGAAGGAGYELGQNEDSTLDSVITSGIVGAGFGGVLGFGLPYGGKLAGHAYGKLPSSWRKGVDDLVDNYLARQAAKTKSKTGGIPPPPDGGGGAAGAVEKGGLPDGATLADIDSDLFPTKAPDAVSVDLKLADKAKRSGIKTADINMFGEMSATERQQARQMIEMADAKVESHSAPHPQIIPGKPVLNQVKRLEAVAEQSGKRLGEIADEMPNQAIPLKTTRIDENGFEHTIDPLGRMLGWLDDSKVRIRKDKAGNIVGLNFDNSAYRGSPFATERAMIEQSFQELFPAQAKGLDIHRTPKEIMQIRRTLREYRMKVEAKLGESTNPVETMIENLRRDLLEPIGAVSDDFRKVNQTYAVSKSARDKFYKDFLGKKFTEATPGELQERIGEVLRRLASNTSATPGMNLRMLREAVEKTYKLTGEEIPEGLLQDPRRLTFLSELINDAWDIKAPTGFQGSIERGIASTIGQGVEIAQDVGQIATGRPISGGLSLLRKVGLGKDPKVARQQLLKDIFKATEEIPLPKVEAAATAKTAVTGQAEKIGGQEAMGAMAGLEPEYDEDGKIKGFKFNPEKAALGMAGMIVGKKAVHFSKMKHIEAPWEKGILRAELSDKTATIKPLKDWALKAGYTWLHNGRINEPAFLQDVLEHTKLYDEYPELKNVMFKMNPKLAKNSGFWDGKAINISDEMDEKAIKPLVLHETQHIIQDMESFAKGGSVDELTKNPDLQRAVIGRMLKDSIELSKTHSEITTKDLDKIFQLYQKANSGEVVPMKDLRELVDTDEGIIEYYHRLAGEWEARRVAQRSEFSQQQLAKRPFYSFFDSDVKSPEDIITLER